jgi:hypothetical protein
MSQKPVIKSENYDLAKTQCRPRTPDAIINSLANQIDRVTESAERIIKEGSVVRDMKGSVIEHPSIKIEASATKLISEILQKWGPRI